MKYIEVRNLKYKNTIKNASFCLSEKWNSFYFSGHTIIPILMGYEEYDGYINIDGNFLSKNNINNLKNKLYYVDKNFYFISNNLYNELLLSGENSESIDNYIINFGLSNYKYKDINEIPFDKKIIVSILYGVLKKFKFIYLDNILCFLSNDDRDKIYSLLMNNNIIVLNFTTNPEELLYSKNVIKKDFSICPVTEINDIKIIDLCDRLINYGILKEKSINIDEVVLDL